MTLFTFDGGYGRIGTVEIIVDQPCSRCSKTSIPVLTMDGSDGEYCSAYLCQPCITTLFHAFEETGLAPDYGKR